MGWGTITAYVLGCCLVAGGYVSFSWQWHLFVWRLWRESPDTEKLIGIFDNSRCSRGYPSFKPGGRWGFFIGGFEVGSRDPRDPLGCLLKDARLWPW